jgi:hypothetical protein
VVCRSEAGTFMWASTLTISGLDNPATLEAMACREALALAQDLSLSHVWLLQVSNDPFLVGVFPP